MAHYDELYKSFQKDFQEIKKELRHYGIEVVFTSIGQQNSELRINAAGYKADEMPSSLTTKMRRCMEKFEQLKILGKL
jgi:hypothetical protein